MKWLHVSLLTAFAMLATAFATAQTPTYSVRQTLKMRDQAARPVEVSVLVDNRWTDEVWKSLWGKCGADWSFELDGSSSLAKDLKAHPPLKAKIEVFYTVAGDRVTLQLDQPLAEIAPLQGGGFLVTTDESIGWGSYAGLRTRAFSINQTAIEQIFARDSGTGKQYPLVLYSALKSGWRKLRDKNGDVTGFLSVSCYPDLSDTRKDQPRFFVDYVRYDKKGGVWAKLARKTVGYWEGDSGFPPRSAFP